MHQGKRPHTSSIAARLGALLDGTPVETIGDDDRIVILSDLHLGDGGRNDDFAHNAELLQAALDGHYRRERFRVVLNGDIEELKRFPLRRIVRRWRSLYESLARFPAGAVTKLFGNHDLELRFRRATPALPPVREALRLRYENNDIFVFHGHQASHTTERTHRISNWLLRFLARPLGIPNYSVALNSRRKYRIEERVYRFARNRKIMAVIGHTHRPLFESLGKVERLTFRIEQLCRLYPEQAPPAQRQTAAEIRRCRSELVAGTKKRTPAGALYHQGPLVPCLFNSGCAIGKSGFTAIEIRAGEIALVHWSDRRRNGSHLADGDHPPQRLGDSDFFRVVIKREPLRYLFARINLLGDESVAVSPEWTCRRYPVIAETALEKGLHGPTSRRAGGLPGPGRAAGVNPNELEFSGKLSDFHLVEVIQFLSLSRKSGELEILDGQRGPVGAVFLSEGDIVHAVMNGSRGVAAFDHILAVSEGFFNFVADRAMPERTVDQPTPALLLHAHHRQDELRRLRALLPADDCVLAIRPDVDPVPPLDTRQWQVLSWVDGRRTLARICQKLDDDLAARQTLLELIGLRLVTPCSAESPLLAIIPLPRPAHTIAGERVYPPRLRTNLLVKSIDGRATVRELGARLNMGPGELAEDLRLLRELQWITFSPADDKVFAGLLLESGG